MGVRARPYRRDRSADSRERIRLVARFYSNENIALAVVAELRRLGHDVRTSLDAGTACLFPFNRDFMRHPQQIDLDTTTRVRDVVPANVATIKPHAEAFDCGRHNAPHRLTDTGRAGASAAPDCVQARPSLNLHLSFSDVQSN
jgi:hypothetical protein